MYIVNKTQTTTACGLMLIYGLFRFFFDDRQAPAEIVAGAMCTSRAIFRRNSSSINMFTKYTKRRFHVHRNTRKSTYLADSQGKCAVHMNPSYPESAGGDR